MGCCSIPKPFKLIVDGEERVVFGLDRILLSTIHSFPSGDQTAAQTLWKGLCLFNPEIGPEEQNVFIPALLTVYNQARQAWQTYEDRAKP